MNRLFLTMAFSLFALFSCKGYGDLSVAEFDKMLAAIDALGA